MDGKLIFTMKMLTNDENVAKWTANVLGSRLDSSLLRKKDVEMGLFQRSATVGKSCRNFFRIKKDLLTQKRSIT